MVVRYRVHEPDTSLYWRCMQSLLTRQYAMHPRRQGLPDVRRGRDMGHRGRVPRGDLRLDNWLWECDKDVHSNQCVFHGGLQYD